jgi:hypothetical protein
VSRAKHNKFSKNSDVGAFFAQRDFAPQNPQGKKPGFAGLRFAAAFS